MPHFDVALWRLGLLARIERLTIEPMTLTERDLLLAALEKELARVEGELAKLLRDLEGTQDNLSRLKQLKDFTAGLPIDQPGSSFTPATTFTAQKPSPNSVHAADSMSNDDIARLAANVLGAVGEPQRAIDLAKLLFSDYDPDRDGRNFEQRLYSIMKRRPEQFAKVARGRWTLTALERFQRVHGAEDAEDDGPESSEQPGQATGYGPGLPNENDFGFSGYLPESLPDDSEVPAGGMIL